MLLSLDADCAPVYVTDLFGRGKQQRKRRLGFPRISSHLHLAPRQTTSIIGPGIANGVVAIKPTVGLTSRGGVIPISESQDSVGPFGRTVTDAARALDAIADPDPDDKHSTVPERKQPPSYYDCLEDRHALKGAQFGLPMKRFWELAPEPQRAVAEQVLQWITDAGAKIHFVDMPCAEERIHEDGHWDWERYGESDPRISEITVSKVETYYLMHEYLSKP